ncbi:D-lactate dehydrogenase VanH-A [Gordonia sp. HY002]|uniref:NAD(P)-dependent oxidoreductase n=1 Tax=Gordonia zhenghanii TaxID=2911516 RepID=UPI001EEFAC7F|nr:NAD(P)-dependent oxidoreductase [Gordonia zhenghanii]MCF8570476.1 D-lactate dehydrogenase VanH-A [Gordonia zhenghanii]MCF8602567.1 D-lactate dehydrogenase VanH-A [Gordonia zhenghanii]
MLFRTVGNRLGVSLTVTAAAVDETNAELARGSRCISVSHRNQITHSMLHALSGVGVEYISTRSVGYDHIDLDYARAVGISVGNVAYSPNGVADYTVMLMLMAVRHTKSTIRRTDSHDYRLGVNRGKELRDLTVGVVGTGRIGTAVVDRLRGFGCRILTHDQRAESSDATLDELIDQSDIVTLHTPLTAGTHHLLDHERIGRMKPGSFVVNTGRGALLDTEALIVALEDGRLAGAALDVLEGEEGVFYSDSSSTIVENHLLAHLQRLPNVLITPHSAYYTDHALNDIVENSIVNCLNFEIGRTA